MQILPLLRSRVFYRLLFALIFLSLCYTGQAQASDRQGDKKVTLSATQIPLKDVFKAIRKQTGMAVMYSNTVVQLNVKEKVTVNFNNTPLEDVMRYLLRDKNNLTFSFEEDGVLILKEDASKKNIAPIKNNVDTSSTVFSLTGKVTDAADGPLAGATILVKGTGQGASTDADGNFTLPNVSNGFVLLVSNVGYETREVKVTGKSILVLLPLFIQSLDETIVIAYGTTTQRYNTGNVSTVKAKDIEKQPVNNPLLALQGRVPGLFITQSTGLAGSGVSVRIQGQNSMGRGNDPFYVIDGVPYTSQLLPSIAGILGTSGNTFGLQQGNPLSFINPADIESIDVLKDADATAIYGSRAANGAILITTKKGKAGRTKVDINMQNGWGRVTRRLDLLNTQQYLQMRREAKQNDGLAIDPTDYDINGFWDTTRYTDWQKTLIGGTAHYTDVQASISGGNATTQYLVGGGYHRETTVFPGDFADQKGSLHFNINSVSINQKFRFQLTGNYLVDNNRLMNTDLTNPAMTTAPDAPPLYNANGSLNWAPAASGFGTWTNPLSYLNSKYKNHTNNLISNAVISYHLLPGLEIKSSFGYTNLQTNEYSSYPFAYFDPSYWPYVQRTARYANNNIQSWIIEPQVTYIKNIGKGKLSALIGTTIQQNNSNGQQFSGSGYNNDQVMEDVKSAATVTVLSSIASIYKYNALFGRLNYNWEDKYIINLTARRDGSSRFGPESQFHNFGAVGIGWIFSKENFIQKKLPFISFGKIRGSYGTTGSDQIGEYQFLNLYSPVSNVGVPYQGATGLEINGLPNPYLEWEETRKLQLGLDLGFLKDRILLNANYFHNRSSNQLLPYALPLITGFADITTNFPATVQNTGWEFSLSTANLKTNYFNWTSSINLTIPKNKLVAFPNLATSSYASNLFIGQPITVQLAYRFLGVDPATGVYQFADSHGSATSSPDFTTDRTVLINTFFPTYYGGFQNNFRYKNFELDILFQFVKQTGNNYFFGNYAGGAMNINQPITVLDRWQKPGDIASHQRYNSDFSLYTQTYAALLSDVAYSDASYIRLKNLSLSWQLPESWRQNAHLQNCRFYIQGQNLFTITNYIGLDPETKSTTTLPPLRVLTIGLQATL